jgi:hypothetical protein
MEEVTEVGVAKDNPVSMEGNAILNGFTNFAPVLLGYGYIQFGACDPLNKPLHQLIDLLEVYFDKKGFSEEISKQTVEVVKAVVLRHKIGETLIVGGQEDDDIASLRRRAAEAIVRQLEADVDHINERRRLERQLLDTQIRKLRGTTRGEKVFYSLFSAIVITSFIFYFFRVGSNLVVGTSSTVLATGFVGAETAARITQTAAVEMAESLHASTIGAATDVVTGAVDSITQGTSATIDAMGTVASSMYGSVAGLATSTLAYFAPSLATIPLPQTLDPVPTPTPTPLPVLENITEAPPMPDINETIRYIETFPTLAQNITDRSVQISEAFHSIFNILVSSHVKQQDIIFGYIFIVLIITLVLYGLIWAVEKTVTRGERPVQSEISLPETTRSLEIQNMRTQALSALLNPPQPPAPPAPPALRDASRRRRSVSRGRVRAYITGGRRTYRNKSLRVKKSL